MTKTDRKVFIIAGEASGDTIGSGIMKAIKQSAPDAVSFYGIGGPLMEAEGMDSIFPMHEISLMGIAEILPKTPDLLKKISYTVEKIEEIQPDVVLSIDAPDFSFRIHKRLSRKPNLKSKKIHCVAPTVWAWREYRAKKISKYLDLLMCLFPFEGKYFNKYGLDTEYIGHPALDETLSLEKISQDTDNKQHKPYTVGLFFGSRRSEVIRHRGIIIKSAKLIQKSFPNICFKTITLPYLINDINNAMDLCDFKCEIVNSDLDKWEFIQSLDVAMAVSGTIGFELALAKVPHVILYKMNPLTWMLIKHFVRVQHAHLVNIILSKMSSCIPDAYRQVRVPEFIQSHCLVDDIAQEMINIMSCDLKRVEYIQLFECVKKILKNNDNTSSSEKAAKIVISSMGL